MIYYIIYFYNIGDYAVCVYDYLILTLVIHISIPLIIQNFDFV